MRDPVTTIDSPVWASSACAAVAIDWSGAKGRRHKGIAIAMAEAGVLPPEEAEALCRVHATFVAEGLAGWWAQRR